MSRLAAGAKKIADKRKAAAAIDNEIEQNGWKIINFKKENVQLLPVVNRMPMHGQLRFGRDATPKTIFKTFLILKCIEGVK